MSRRHVLTPKTECPIECLCSHAGERSQLDFANRAVSVLGEPDGVVLETRTDGLVVMAETETALERQLEILREVYGAALRVEGPRIRYRGGGNEEPYMGVRVSCASHLFDAVKADLERLGASILDAERTPQIGVVRASAPLEALLGYPRRLASLTRGQAREVMWLSHYAPVTRQPARMQAGSS